MTTFRLEKGPVSVVTPHDSCRVLMIRGPERAMTRLPEEIETFHRNPTGTGGTVVSKRDWVRTEEWKGRCQHLGFCEGLLEDGRFGCW